MPPVKQCKKPTKRLKSNVPALIHVRQDTMSSRENSVSVANNSFRK